MIPEGLKRAFESKEKKTERLYGLFMQAVENVRRTQLSLRSVAQEAGNTKVLDELRGLEVLEQLLPGRMVEGRVRSIHDRARDIESYASDIKQHFETVARAWNVPEHQVTNPELLKGEYPFLYDFYKAAHLVRDIAQQFKKTYVAAYPNGG